MTADELLARESIRELVARYAVGVDSGRFEDALSVFGPDSTMELDSDQRLRRGPEEIVEIFQGAGETFSAEAGAAPVVRHHLTTHKIELTSPTTAKGRLYFLVIVGQQLDHWGRYFDRYELVAGSWRIASRRVTIDHRIGT
jgi:hypothetical protein